MPRDIGQKWNPTVKQPSSFNTEISTDIPQTHLSNLGTTNDHDHHDSFRDVLSTEPVLSGDNPGVKKSESNNGTDEDDQDTTDSTSLQLPILRVTTGMKAQVTTHPIATDCLQDCTTWKDSKETRVRHPPWRLICRIDQLP